MRTILLAIFFEFGAHFGVAGWNAQTDYVDHQVGLNAGGQAYFSWISSEIYGLRTGFTLDVHNSAFSKSNYQDAYSTLDVDEQRMDIAYSIGQLQERHTVWSFGIPLQLGLNIWNFTLFAGPKVVFPLSATYRQNIKNAALSVYYPDYDNRVEESATLAASRSFEYQSKGKIEVPKVQFWLATELNYTLPIENWATNYRTYIMVGAYFDYCLTPLTPAAAEAESLIMLTDTRDGFPLQRLYTSVWEGNRQNTKLVSRISPFDVGIKISFAISPFDPHPSAHHSCHCL